MDIKKIRDEIDFIDKEMAILFEKRMEQSFQVAQYKKEHDLPIFDQKREREVILKNKKLIKNSKIEKHYTHYLKSVMDISKEYQEELLNKDRIIVKTSASNYEIVLKNELLKNIEQYLNLERKILIITDDGIPSTYLDLVKVKCKNSYIYCIHQGEKSKNFDNYQKILLFLIEHQFTRFDAIIALGGGVVGDLSGFVASTYLRGIDYYQIPTTLLSQVDSSIGGKTAIDIKDYKNLVGAFYPPKKVLIDPLTLLTLDKRQLHAGLVEALKMSLTHDKTLFDLIKNSNDLMENIKEIIYRAIMIKKQVVEQDEKEASLRQVLNFGHTLGHAIESYHHFEMLHGECVGMGMLYFTSEEVRTKLIPVLKKYSLPITNSIQINDLITYLEHDKKVNGNKIKIVYVPEIGKFEIKELTFKELYNYLVEVKL